VHNRWYGAGSLAARQDRAVPDPEPNEQLLTVDQAYLAAYQFIRQFYERDGRKPKTMFLLMSWMEMEHPRQSDDPAQWSDWMKSVDRALKLTPEEQFAEPISPPLSE
jgi:hypothetical protein